jgi:uncharacterized membrane protein
MEKDKPAFKTKVIYGLIVLVPMAVIAMLVVQIVGALDKLAKLMGLHSTLGVVLAMILALAALLLLCYAMGALVRTKVGSWSYERLEKKLLKQIPGYQLLKNLLTGFVEMKSAYPAALVRLGGPGAEVLGFVMEKHPGGRVTVFVPLAPMVSMGSVYIVEDERVTILEANALEVTGCISQWGVGSREILGNRDSK